jgi:hypothetical protein
MVLRADVTATGDRLLFKAGTELREPDLRTLAMWGVAEVDVEGTSEEDLVAEATAELPPGELETIHSSVTRLFRHNDRADPIIEELARLTTRRLIRRARGSSDGP